MAGWPDYYTKYQLIENNRRMMIIPPLFPFLSVQGNALNTMWPDDLIRLLIQGKYTMTFIMPKLVITHSGDEIDTSPVNNREVRKYLSSLNSVELDGMPGWIEDIISGATSQVGGSARIGRGRLFVMLLALDEITPATVAMLMNRKRDALGEAPYGDRHCRKVAAALRCASNGIKHHRAKYDPSPAEDKAPSFQPSPLPYSDEEMRELKRLSLNATFAELQNYESSLKEKYNKEKQA